MGSFLLIKFVHDKYCYRSDNMLRWVKNKLQVTNRYLKGVTEPFKYMESKGWYFLSGFTFQGGFLMDNFIEKIIKKQKTGKDYLITVGLVFAGIVLFLVIQNFKILASFALVVLVGIVYGIYYVSTTRNIEYEFILTNDELDIDKIISRRKRKRIFSGSCKNFDVLAKLKSDKYTPEVVRIKKRIEAVSSLASPNVFFATLNYKGERTVLFFEPDERMLNMFKGYIPRKFFN